MNKTERTLLVVKPDGVVRSLVGEVVSRIERTGLKLVGIKMVRVTPEHVEKHYTLDENWFKNVGKKGIEGAKKQGAIPPTDDPEEMSKLILSQLVDYITSGPVVAMVWQGAHAVEIVRKLVGDTEPRSSSTGTIRGDFVHDSYPLSNKEGRAVRNVVHAAGSVSEAEQEIYHWFNENELCDYVLLSEALLYKD